MKTIFIDSNVFLRFFTRDDAGQHELAAKLFRTASEGRLQLVSGPPVLFEIAWVLRSAYNHPKEKVLEILSAICALPFLELTDQHLVENAIVLARNANQEFADAYLAALAKQTAADAVATFNRQHFRRLGATIYEF